MNTQKQEKFNELVSNFLLNFENVFDIDWDLTKEIISNDPEGNFINEGGSFIRPMCGNESSNWNNRGALLAAYRALVQEAERMGIFKSDLS